MNFLRTSLKDIIRQLNERFNWLTYDGSDLTISDNVKLSGDATAWEDVQESLIGKRLAATSGKVDYDYDENRVKFERNGSISTTNDRIAFNIQLPHAAKDSELRVHMHFEDTGLAGTFTIRYRIQSNGQARTTSWTTTTANTSNAVFTYSSGTLNNLLSLVNIDLTGTGLSDVVQIQVARTDSTSGDIYATFIDAHYEVDAFGSDTEFTK